MIRLNNWYDCLVESSFPHLNLQNAIALLILTELCGGRVRTFDSNLILNKDHHLIPICHCSNMH